MVAQGGRAVAGGHASHRVAFDVDTPVVLRSVAKFLTSLVVHRLVHEGALSVAESVFDAGKSVGPDRRGRLVTLGDILRQRSELFGLRDVVMRLPDTRPADVLVQLSAQQASDATAQQVIDPAYHPVTWGLLVDHCVSRATGASVTQHCVAVAERLSLPLLALADQRVGALDHFVRLPLKDVQRAARRDRAVAEIRFLRALRDRGSDTWSAYRSLPVADALSGGLARLGNVGLSLAGSAREVALWAAAAAEGTVFGDMRTHEMGRPASGYDRVLTRPMAWTSGALELPESVGVPRGALGFMGGGGSIVIAHPPTGVGISVVSNLTLSAVGIDPLLADILKCAWASID